MRPVTVLGLGVLLAWAAGAPADDKPKFDPAKMVGKWQVTSGVKMGEKVDPDRLKEATWEVTKDQMTLVSGGGTFKFKYKVDPKADPAAVDLEMTDSPFGGGATAKGIVALEKGELKISYHPMGGDRPTKFDGEKGFLFVAKKADDKK